MSKSGAGEGTVRHGPWPGATTTPQSTADGGGPTPPMIGERLAKLEAAVEALRHGHDILLGVMAIGFGLVVTLLIAFGTYTLSRIDSIPTDFERTNQMLSSAITASKQQQAPQIIVIPRMDNGAAMGSTQKKKPENN